MRAFYLLCLIIAFLLSCKSKPHEAAASTNAIPLQENIANNNTSEENSTSQYDDGEYCATIGYYNSSTGTSSTYTLEVEVENGKLVRINWPNGGWLDSSHFSPPELEADGACSFSTFDGKEYEVQIEGGGCSLSNSSPEDQDEGNESEDVEQSQEEENEDPG